MKKIVFLLVAGMTILACSKSSDTNNSNAQVTGPYFPTVKSIIQTNCLSCHSTGRVVDLSVDANIELYAPNIKADVVSKRMPVGGTLKQSDIDTIVAWYQKGGKTTD